MRVLTYTTLFPNSLQPLCGHFVFERLRHVVAPADSTVIAPVPYFPGAASAVRVAPRWQAFGRVPRHETIGGYQVAHPSYVVIPRVGMATHGLAMFLGSLRQVSREMRQREFGLIDAHYVYPDGFAAILLGRRFGKPVVVSARGTDINLFPTFRTIRPLIRFVLRHADGLVAVSDALRQSMLRLGAPPEITTVIGNGVDPGRFSPGDSEAPRSLAKLPMNGPVLLSVGRLVEGKGFQILVSALDRLRMKWPTIQLVIIGEGPYRTELKRQVAALGLEDRVHLPGACLYEQMREWYLAADLFCLASAREGHPNVVLEAMACGLPVVATRVGGIPEIVSSEALGILTEGNADAFAAAIDGALSRSWNRQLIACAGRSRTWDTVSEEVKAVFNRTVAQYANGIRR